MKFILGVLVVLLLMLQFKLWFGDGNMFEVWRLRSAVEVQQNENAQLREKNEALAAEVNDLKQGLEAVEERARRELGMVKEGETFYQIVEEPKAMNKN